MDGTPVPVVFLRMPVASVENKTLFTPLTTVAPPVAVLVASPESAEKTPVPDVNRVPF
jgi:hypothetical protein